MASNSSGASYGSISQKPTNSSSDADPEGLPAVAEATSTAEMEQRKRKRMLSNRESARRSRMRKKKHLDELNKQAERQMEENDRLAAGLSVVLRLSLAVEAENSVLWTQMEECIQMIDSFIKPWETTPMAAAFQYC